MTLLIQTPDGDTTIYRDSHGKKIGLHVSVRMPSVLHTGRGEELAEKKNWACLGTLESGSNLQQISGTDGSKEPSPQATITRTSFCGRGAVGP